MFLSQSYGIGYGFFLSSSRSNVIAEKSQWQFSWMKHIYDPPQHRRYILPRRLLIPLLFLACLAEIGLTAPATNLPLLYTSFPYHTEDLLWTLSHAAPEAQLEEALVLTAADGICSLTLGSSIITLVSRYFFLKIGAKMVCMICPLEIRCALSSSARSSSDLVAIFNFSAHQQHCEHTSACVYVF